MSCMTLYCTEIDTIEITTLQDPAALLRSVQNSNTAQWVQRALRTGQTDRRQSVNLSIRLSIRVSVHLSVRPTFELSQVFTFPTKKKRNKIAFPLSNFLLFSKKISTFLLSEISYVACIYSSTPSQRN